MRLITNIKDKHGVHYNSVSFEKSLGKGYTIYWVDLDTKEQGSFEFTDERQVNGLYGAYSNEDYVDYHCLSVMTQKDYEFLQNLELVWKNVRDCNLDFHNKEISNEEEHLISERFNKMFFTENSLSDFGNIVQYMMYLMKVPEYDGKFWRLRGDTLSLMTLKETYIFRIRNKAKFSKMLLMG